MHEILGIALAILIIIHILLNFKWIKQVTKNFKKNQYKTENHVYNRYSYNE